MKKGKIKVNLEVAVVALWDGTPLAFVCVHAESSKPVYSLFNMELISFPVSGLNRTLGWLTVFISYWSYTNAFYA